MKAATFHHFGGAVHVEDVEDPRPAAAEVVVRVACCQIGGDILKIMAGNGPVRDRERFAFPHTPGYRGAGVVDAVGFEVEGLAVGDRVVINGFLNCGQCDFCRQGHDNLCERSHMLGVDSGRPGAMAEFVTAPARAVYRLPDDVTFEQSTVLPNIALLVHAFRRAEVSGPFSCAVYGCGLTGTAAIAVARALGATQIIGVDTAASALELARSCGATLTVDPGREDPVAAVRDATGGAGADVVAELVGLGVTIANAVRSTRTLGVTLLIGALGETTIPFPDYYGEVVQRELDLRTCFGKGQEDFAEAVRLAESGALDLSPFPVRVHDFEDIADAIEVAGDPANSDIHVVSF
jgi:L-iditol 2-dehydrogenase